MKKLNLSLFVLLLLGITSCSTTKESVATTTTNDKTVINYSRTLSAKQANQIIQILNEELIDFPDSSLPISFVNNTEHSRLSLYLKKRKIKFSFHSNLSLNEENEEVMTMQRIKEKIVSL